MITLLIVDDSPVAREILKRCLPKDRMFSIVEAVNGQDGLEKFRQYRPEVTFMDLTMPIMDGFEAMTEIRKLDPQAIIIATTADVQKKARQKIIDLGGLMQLAKPVNRDAIKDALAEAEAILKGQI